MLKNREIKSQTQHDFKNVRYKAIILLANALLDFEKHLPELKKHGRDFISKEQLVEELKIERNNMILFASDQAIKTLSEFVSEPSENNYYEFAIAMRKDLYGLKTKIRPSNLKFQ